MKVKQKSTLGTINKILFAVLVIVSVVFAFKVCLSSPPVAPVDGSNASKDEAVIDAFQAGTYGGVAMNSEEDAVKYYVEAYNKTKAKTSTYKNEDGTTEDWYTFLGDEDLSINTVLIEGKANAVIDKIVPGIVKNLFAPSSYGLPPCTSRNPTKDLDESGGNFMTSRLTDDDVLVANVKDNNDGTITMEIQPKASEMSHRGMDSQGNFFNTLGGIDEVVDSISVLSWAEGTTADNCKVSYKGGTGIVKIDTKTGEIIEADYVMQVDIAVTHATVTVIKNKNATVNLTYSMHFPASPEYIQKNNKAALA